MPPIIEDYAAIKRRMDEFTLREPHCFETRDGKCDRNCGAVCKRFADAAASILTDEGRALIEKHKGDL